MGKENKERIMPVSVLETGFVGEHVSAELILDVFAGRKRMLHFAEVNEADLVIGKVESHLIECGDCQTIARKQVKFY